MEISRDKKNPTWAYVWQFFNDIKHKRIILDICDNGVICVDSINETDYVNGMTYDVVHWRHYEIIQPKKIRPFKDGAEFCEWLKKTGRTDMRVKTEEGFLIITSSDNLFVYFEQFNLTYVNAYNHRWFDNNQQIGIEE